MVRKRGVRPKRGDYSKKLEKKRLKGFFRALKWLFLLLDRVWGAVASYKTIITAFLFLVLIVGGFYVITSQFPKKQLQVVLEDKDIIKKVGAHVELPKGYPLKVVRVEDETMLRTQNIFYQDVKRGDYIIAYQEMVIIYRLLEDRIIAVKKQ